MMTTLFRIVLVVVSIGTMQVIFSRIRKSKLSIEDAVFWILLSVMFVLFALFPVIPDTLARLLGIYSTANFLFLFLIFLLAMRLFSMSMRVSVLEDKLRDLIEEMALRDEREKRMKSTADTIAASRAEAPRSSMKEALADQEDKS